MKLLIVIPARYDSTRFPGKPLADMKGKTMIQRVYEQCLKADADRVIVATDSSLVFDAVVKFGGTACMTKQCESGTERVCQTVLSLNEKYDIIVNVQGDEPFIEPEDINRVIDMIQARPDSVATLVSKLESKEKLDRNVVKALLDIESFRKVSMFTRSPIYGKLKNSFKHIGIYAFSYDTLETISNLKDKTLNESIDNLEQLRWLDNGVKINAGHTKHQSIGIDTRNDLFEALKLL